VLPGHGPVADLLAKLAPAEMSGVTRMDDLSLAAGESS
jgi:hypothetical protein